MDRDTPRGQYGKFVHEASGTAVLAHRFAYEMFVGAIPEGMQIDHLCQNKRCVNPEHMELVTPGENISRSHRYPRKYPAKLTPDRVEKIREQIASGESVTRIANAFGVARQTIGDIRSGRTWRQT